MSVDAEILYDPAHHWKSVEDVPPDAIDFFLSGHVGTFTARGVKVNGRKLLKTLRYLREKELWDRLEGVTTWAECLAWFDLTEAEWEWLQAGEPVLDDSDTKEQAIAKGKERATYLEAGQAWLNEEGTQEEIAEKFGITQEAVSKGANLVITESCDSQKKVIVPPHLKGDHEKADFRKLSPQGQARVCAGEPVNRVCLDEGIRRKLTPLETAQKSFRKLSKPDRDAFDLWRAEQPL